MLWLTPLTPSLGSFGAASRRGTEWGVGVGSGVGGWGGGGGQESRMRGGTRLIIHPLHQANCAKVWFDPFDAALRYHQNAIRVIADCTPSDPRKNTSNTRSAENVAFCMQAFL